MNKLIFRPCFVLLAIFWALMGCGARPDNQTIHFAVSSDEFCADGESDQQNSSSLTARPAPIHGMVVIESDDGLIGDYTHWYPLFKKKIQPWPYFPFFKKVVANSAINSSAIGVSRGVMNAAQLQEMAAYGWGIINHGRWHIGLGTHILQSDVTAGATTLPVSEIGRIMIPASYRILDHSSEHSEVLKVVSKSGYDGYEPGLVRTESALQFSYAQGSEIALVPALLEQTVNGSLIDLAILRIPIANEFVFPWHGWNEQSLMIVARTHSSARSCSGSLNPIPIRDGYQLSGIMLASLSFDDIDARLDDTMTKNQLFLTYGHGETTPEVLAALEYLVDGAIARGIPILRRQEAMAWLRSLEITSPTFP